MDIRDILKSFDQLSESGSTIHKAGPGGYGNRHGSEDVTDQYGKPIGRASLSKMSDAPAVKRGKGRPPKAADSSGEVKSYDSSELSKAMGIGKAPKPTGKPSVKHSLKEYFDQMDKSVNEAGLAVQPMPATAQQQQQKAMASKPAFMIKDPANPNMPAITTQDPAVVQAAKNGTMSMQKPGAAPTSTGAKPATGAGSQFGAMAEAGDVGKHNNATTGFDALVRKLTPKYGKEAATKIAGSQLKKIKEADAPQYFAQSSPLSTPSRDVLEGKKSVNPFAKKEETDKKKCPPMSHIKKMCQDGKSVAEICKMHPDCDQKELKQMVADCKKKLSEGAKPDFLDMDKDGDKKEPMKKAVSDKKGSKPQKGVNPFAKKTEKQKVKEGMEHNLQAARLEGKSHALRKMPYNCTHDNMEEARHYHDGFKEGLDECYGQMPILGRTAVDEMGSEVGTMAGYGATGLGEMDKTSYMKQQAIKTPGDTFKAFGQTMSDKDVIDEFAFEAFDKQLNALLESEEKVSEGMTVSISKGQQGSPDSVSVSAQDGEADQLLSIIKSAGMGLFGGDEQNGYGAPQGTAGAHGGINVVDDHDGMMALMKKLSGGEMQNSSDYEDEESSEEGHMHGEETCNECGGMMEAGHSCGSKEMVDEVESEDQMEFEVAENAPDSGADNTNADVAGNAAANSALATADAGEDEEEGQIYSKPVSEDGDDEAEAETDADDTENVAESFANLYKKLAFLSEESTEKEDEKAEKAGKKVAKDIEYDEGHKGKDDDKAEKAGKKVTKDIEYDDKKDKKKIDEWANEAGKNGTDAAFEADIDFMTKVISGGLNKQKSTGQTTIPVVSGQSSRMGVDGLGNPMKESTDLLKDYLKLSGL